MYLLWTEKVERQAYADGQLAALMIVLGGQVTEVPDAYQARKEFDTWLTSEPEMYDPDKEALMIALGLR